jgi:hypothetical protein
MKILNWITDHELDQLKRRGWIERRRERRPDEGRILLTLWHPRQAAGDGHDRHLTAVETFRSLPLDTPAQLLLFAD